MDSLNKSYITLLDSDKWTILASDSISTVMRWSKRTKWCTKSRDVAASELSSIGDCIAFIQDDMRKPHYLMFSDSGKVWNRNNDPLKACNFFGKYPEIKSVVVDTYPQIEASIQKQLNARAERHQRLYWSDEYKCSRYSAVVDLPWSFVDETIQRPNIAELLNRRLEQRMAEFDRERLMPQWTQSDLERFAESVDGQHGLIFRQW